MSFFVCATAMLLEQELSAHTPDRPAVCTIGVFDGVHRGHHALIKQTIAVARRQDALSVVLVFHPHPRTVLSPGAVVPLLTGLQERLALIKARGIDVALPISFTRELSQLSAEAFIAILKNRLNLTGLVVGPGFALGRGRQGTVAVLEQLGQRMGFSVTVVAPHEMQGQLVSSTSVRQALAEGDVRLVSTLLDRPYSTEGVVQTGDRRGRWLGYPTANLAPSPEFALPADGIYATRVQVDGATYDAAAYIGTSPTFEGKERLVEVFLLDYQGELYGKQMTVEWVDRVREDRAFESAGALQEQMGRDVAAARAALIAHRPPPTG